MLGPPWVACFWDVREVGASDGRLPFTPHARSPYLDGGSGASEWHGSGR